MVVFSTYILRCASFLPYKRVESLLVNFIVVSMLNLLQALAVCYSGIQFFPSRTADIISLQLPPPPPVVGL
jgi:hypothetical protein